MAKPWKQPSAATDMVCWCSHLICQSRQAESLIISISTHLMFWAITLDGDISKCYQQKHAISAATAKCPFLLPLGNILTLVNWYCAQQAFLKSQAVNYDYSEEISILFHSISISDIALMLAYTDCAMNVGSSRAAFALYVFILIQIFICLAFSWVVLSVWPHLVLRYWECWLWQHNYCSHTAKVQYLATWRGPRW